jgi:hypothetical protein
MQQWFVCLKCGLGLGQVKSYESGFCHMCRLDLIPECIPVIQHKRYLKRIGAYKKYKKISINVLWKG